jgi:hypothetical protein
MAQARVLPLVMECGTLSSAEMQRRVVDDNWLHLYGKLESERGQRIKTDLVHGFIPQDDSWQQICLATSPSVPRKIMVPAPHLSTVAGRHHHGASSASP